MPPAAGTEVGAQHRWTDSVLPLACPQEQQLLVLAELPQLRALDLSHSPAAGDALLCRLASHPELRELNISCCSRAGPMGLLALGHSSSLRRVLVSSARAGAAHAAVPSCSALPSAAVGSIHLACQAHGTA